MKNELRSMLSIGERVLYEGKPDIKTFLFETIFSPFLPIALIWAIFDFGFIITMFQGLHHFVGVQWFLVPFFMLHLTPVWIYLGSIIFLSLRYKNEYYIVTDRAIYISSGVFVKRYVTKMFAQMSHIDIHRGIFDQFFQVGDVVITTDQMVDRTPDTLCLKNLKDYLKVYELIKRLQQDIYADIMYPNDLRPQDNHGYHTNYKG